MERRVETIERRSAGARPHTAADDLLGRNDAIRARLASALETERITPYGLTVLRDHYRLTPAETNVFVEYYLGRADLAVGTPSMRRELAQELNLSENTLMHHITSIRSKLGLAARKGSATVLMWCLAAGITNLRAVTPRELPDPNVTTGQTGRLTA